MNPEEITGLQPIGARHSSAGQGIRKLLIGVCCIQILVLIGCSKSTTPTQSDLDTDPSISLADQESQTRIPEALQQLESSQLLVNAAPSIYSSEMLADSGLQVAYSSAGQKAQVPASLIEANWLHMQECLNQVSVAPLVIIRDEGFAPMTSNDIVIHSLEGVPVASLTLEIVPIVQIGINDFLASADSAGANLRSILGRLIWSSADLAVRDYPYEK